MRLYIPKNDGVKMNYYRSYYMSVARSAAFVGIDVAVSDDPDKVWCGKSKNAYMASLDNKQFIMDFSDFPKLQVRTDKFNCPYFKWQYSMNMRYDCLVHPLCPLQDYDWPEFILARNEVTYRANGEVITNCQRVRAGAEKRRRDVQGILKREYANHVKTEFIDQKRWWRMHGNCLVAVHVPGARNNMLDRGQLELMGLGVCVISPKIETVLAGDIELNTDEHYLRVFDDYSDLIETVEWCRCNRDRCIEIGRQARALFDEVAEPSQYWSYIWGILNE